MRQEKFAEICELFGVELGKDVTAEQLRAPWAAAVAQLGPITEIGDPIIEPGPAQLTLVKVPVRCTHEGFAFVVTVDSTGDPQRWSLGPLEEAEPWLAPSYADPSLFTENDIAVGSGPLAVPGTLSLPATSGRVPAVVQLPGSGPMNRDSTVGRNKPLKDVAWGLASRGIAVLRFDKVTRVHPGKLADHGESVMTTEYVEHALAAVRLLRDHPSIDPGRVFVLGHSQGGTVAPRIATAEPALAGLIVLAGATYPLHLTTVRQARYLASLFSDVDVDSDPGVQEATRHAALIGSPDLSASTRPISFLRAPLPPSGWSYSSTTRSLPRRSSTSPC